MLERINQELKRRTLVVRIFPTAASCLRLIRALAVEIHEDWMEAIRYHGPQVAGLSLDSREGQDSPSSKGA